MNSLPLTKVCVATIFGFSAAALPLATTPTDSLVLASELTIPTPDVGAILDPDPDFFDQGRSQLEQEIEWLMQEQLAPERPVLILDESVGFDAELLESFEEPVHSSNEVLESP